MKILSLAVILALFMIPALVSAKETTDLRATEAWATASLKGAETTAAYVTIENTSDTALTITDIDTPNAHAMIHSMTNDNGVMRMRHLNHIDIPAHQTVKLEKHGMHIMLMHMDAPLKEGDTLPLTFTLSNGDTLTVNAPVKAQQ